jgi:transcriptional regulator with XRE-family HTH domain
MELGNRIKELRKAQNINQDDLAEKLFVSRQTISNWENDKSYPDIQSVLLLSEIFSVSIDNLLKGDVEKMEEVITEDTEMDIRKMNFYSGLMLIFYAGLLVMTPILAYFIGWWFLIPCGIWSAIGMYFAMKIEGIKKKHDVQTYKEIIAFTKGETLSSDEKMMEGAKRPYQKVLMMIASAVVAIVVAGGVIVILKIYA